MRAANKREDDPISGFSRTLLDATKGRPFGLYLHGNEGTEGAERAVDGITAGLAWVKAAEYVVVAGEPGKDDLQACWELGATVAAQLMG